MTGQKNIAYLQLAASMAIVGSSVVVGKIIIGGFPVFLASGLRFGLGVLILLPLLYQTENGFKPVARRDWLFLFLQAFAGVFMFSVLLLYGLKFTGAASAGIITSTTPAMVGLISFLFFKERMTWFKSAGIALSVAGILLINVFGEPTSANAGSNPLLGNLLVFAAVLGEALFIIFQKAISRAVSPLATATWVNVLGLLMFLPPALWEARSFDFSSVGWAAWLGVLYYAVALTVIAYLLWFNGTAVVPAGTAGVFSGVMPISALVLSYGLLGEPFAWVHLIGGACVLLGIGFVTRSETESAPVEVALTP